MAKFVGVIHKDADSDFGVSFLDFPGCITAGETMEEAFKNAHEALQGHIDVMYEYGEELPSKALSLDECGRHAAAKGHVAFFVVEAELPLKAKRINVSLDERLIRRIDDVTSNRSGFLAEAAREKLRNFDALR